MEKRELKDFCSENLLDEKLFMVSGITVAKQMINRMAREGYSSINLRPVTLQGLAFEICQEYILREKKLIVDSILGNNLIIDILKDLHKKERGFFFNEDLIDTKTSEEVYRVIMELKYSGLKSFPKTKDLDKIYVEYEKRLKELNAMDYCDVISLAMTLDKLRGYRDKKIAVASNIEFYNIEKLLFEKLTEKNCTRIKMPVYLIDEKPKNYYYKDKDKPSTLKNRNIRFKGEYGRKNEINYVINDIKKKRIKLDNVVIAYTNGNYTDLLNIEFEKENIPITFGEGLGIRSSSTYRFIETIFNWANNYYNVDEIRSIFVNGDIKINLNGEKNISAPDIFEELLQFRIVFGRKNYIERLGKSNRREVLWLRELFKDLFLVIPEENNINIKNYIPKLISLIRKYVKNINKYDGAAKIEILKTLRKIEDTDMEVSRMEYFDIVLSYIKKSRILRAQAQPGHVFATNFKHGGYTGRENLYLIGMDSNSLSNKVIESPILLDFNRRKISDNLSSAKEAYNYKKYKIRELLTSDFKNITILYSNFDTTNVKEKSPSQIYIELRDKYGSSDTNGEEQTYQIYGRDLVTSVTALETLAECSRKAYLRYILGLEPKDERDTRVDKWLNPLEKGIIVHNVLNTYFDLGGKEDIDYIVQLECEKMKERVVCILEDVYNREKQEILSICQDMVNNTKKDKEWEILANELSFGHVGMKRNKIFGVLPSQKIKVMGLNLDISGSIDRVDRNKSDPNLFRIVDYKTGSVGNFNKKLRNGEDDYSKTKKLQYYIYKVALEKILEEKRDKYADFKVEKFTYMFPGKTSKSIIDLDFTEDFTKVIEGRIKELLELNIFEEEKNIVYDPDDESLSCKYCEFSTICMSDKREKEGEEVGE